MTRAPTEPRLVVHHVGGRDGSMSFRVRPPYRDDVLTVLYDADEDCIEQARSGASYYGEHRVLPYCLGAKRGPGELHITLDPFASSTLRANPDLADFYSFLKVPGGLHADWVLGEALRTVETRKVEMQTLDGLLREGKLLTPAPDFLSLDTQGSEYDILLGAREMLGEHTLGVATEIEFLPMYSGQQRFHEILALLEELGFRFVRFLTLAETAPWRAPVGARGQGFHTWGDALFLKPFSRLVERSQDASALALSGYKLAFIAVCFGQVELALQTLHQVDALGTAPALPESDGPGYPAFLRKLARQAAELPPLYPPSYSDVKDRVAAASAPAPRPSRFRRRLRRLGSSIGKRAALARQLPQRRLTPFERTLLEFGLKDVAELVRERRLAQQAHAKHTRPSERG